MTLQRVLMAFFAGICVEWLAVHLFLNLQIPPNAHPVLIIGFGCAGIIGAWASEKAR